MIGHSLLYVTATPKEIIKFLEYLNYRSNNCGACETCLRLFGEWNKFDEDYSSGPPLWWEHWHYPLHVVPFSYQNHGQGD